MTWTGIFCLRWISLCLSCLALTGRGMDSREDPASYELAWSISTQLLTYSRKSFQKQAISLITGDLGDLWIVMMGIQSFSLLSSLHWFIPYVQSPSVTSCQ
jgi:hypothetical protein